WAGITDARYRTTTEVYPDSPRTTPDRCNEAPAVAVCAALDYVLEHGGAAGNTEVSCHGNRLCVGTGSRSARLGGGIARCAARGPGAPVGRWCPRRRCRFRRGVGAAVRPVRARAPFARPVQSGGGRRRLAATARPARQPAPGAAGGRRHGGADGGIHALPPAARIA